MQDFDAEVLPYHWDNRQKLASDYNYLSGFYEKLLLAVAQKLNELQQVDRSLRYWRIVLGPWLGYFVQIVFDRWYTINDAIEKYKLSGTNVLSIDESVFIPQNMNDFVELFVDDNWNHFLYSYIIKNFTQLPIVENIKYENRQFLRHRLRLNAVPFVDRLFTYLSGVMSRKRDVFLYATYLPDIHQVRLTTKLRQFPQKWTSFSADYHEADLKKRDWKLGFDYGSTFEEIITHLLPYQIPTCYLEGYNDIVKKTKQLCWPKKPDLIFTSNAHVADDVFKVWAAEKAEAGTPLVVGQHGGFYGIGRWGFNEDHDTSISDAFLSWGWNNPEKTNIQPVGQLKVSRPLGVNHFEQKYLLLVTTTFPRYSYWLCSAIVAGQWTTYYSDQLAFVNTLSDEIKSSTIVRLYNQDYGNDQLLRWSADCPGTKLDDGTSNIIELIKKSKLYVSTYNATTFLESFAMNIPTIIFWNQEHWELRDSSIPYFDELRSVKIFHDTPESAAKQVNRIWNNVDAWWNSAEVTAVVKKFTSRYVDNTVDVVEKLYNIIGEVKK